MQFSYYYTCITNFWLHVQVNDKNTAIKSISIYFSKFSFNLQQNTGGLNSRRNCNKIADKDLLNSLPGDWFTFIDIYITVHSQEIFPQI